MAVIRSSRSVVQAGEGVAQGDGMPSARLAAIWRMRYSPPETGICPSCRAVCMACQSIRAIGVSSLMDAGIDEAAKSWRCKIPP